MGKDLNSLFTKEDTQMNHKHMKRCSMVLVMREMQVKSNEMLLITSNVSKDMFSYVGSGGVK